MDKDEIDSFAPELESRYARSEDIRRSCWLKTVALRTFWSTALSPKRLFQTRKDFPWFTTKMKTNPTTELKTSNGQQLGKSSKGILEALAMTSGKPLLGVQPAGCLRVLLINLED